MLWLDISLVDAAAALVTFYLAGPLILYWFPGNFVSDLQVFNGFGTFCTEGGAVGYRLWEKNK